MVLGGAHAEADLSDKNLDEEMGLKIQGAQGSWSVQGGISERTGIFSIGQSPSWCIHKGKL